MSNPTNNLEEKIAEAMGVKHYEKRFNKGALAAKSWYLRVDLFDDDFEEVVGHQYVNKTTEVKKLVTLFTSYANQVANKDLDMLELAWGIIANSYNGDWSTASQDWQEAAARWCDDYHNVLNQLRRGE